jgi:hypothetical protein
VIREQPQRAAGILPAEFVNKGNQSSKRQQSGRKRWLKAAELCAGVLLPSWLPDDRASARPATPFASPSQSGSHAPADV